MHRSLNYNPAEVQKSSPNMFYGKNHIREAYAKDTMADESDHFVFWSGGCDSTLLLYELLDAYGPDKVTAVSYRFPWLYDKKAKSEQHCRELFLMKMRNRGLYPFNYIEMDVGIKEVLGNIQARPSGLPQSCSWLLSIPVFIPEGSYIYEGGIKEDELTMYRTEYEQVFTNMCSILDKRLILRRPYIYFNKHEIIDKLFKYDLYDCTWHCEIPSDVGCRCGKCVPCRTHQAALLYLREFGDGTAKYRADDILRDFELKKSQEAADPDPIKADDSDSPKFELKEEKADDQLVDISEPDEQK